LLFSKFALVERGGVPVSASGDSIQQVWFLAWPAAALRHGWNPFITHELNAPYGANMMNNTSMLLLGTLAAPLTWIFGPIATYLTLLRVGFTLTALSAAVASKKLGLSWKAAWFAGLLVGFASYRVTVGQVHVFAAFDVTTPWVFYGLVRFAQRRWSVRRFGLVIGALIGFGGLISLERATRDSFMVACVVAILLVHRRSSRRELQNLLKALVAVGLVAGAILAVPLWYFQFGDFAVTGTKHSREFYQAFSTTIESLFLPGTGNVFHPFGALGKGAFLAGGFTNASYLGFGLMGLAGLGVWLKRGDVLIRSIAIADLIFILFSFGESVRVFSVEVPLPGALLTPIPGFSDITPSRWINEAIVATAFLGGVALDAGFAKEAKSQLKALTAALFGLTIVSFIPNKVIDRANAPAEGWFRSPTAAQVMAKNPVVLTYPYTFDIFNSSMLDQAASGINYRMVGGQAIVPGPPEYMNHVAPLDPPEVFSVFTCSYFGTDDPSIEFGGHPICPRPTLTPTTVRAFKQFVADNQVGVIVWRKTGAEPLVARNYLRAAFGEGHHDAHDLVEWWKFGASQRS
jgi:hypothetical protein